MGKMLWQNKKMNKLKYAIYDQPRDASLTPGRLSHDLKMVERSENPTLMNRRI